MNNATVSAIDRVFKYFIILLTKYKNIYIILQNFKTKNFNDCPAQTPEQLREAVLHAN